MMNNVFLCLLVGMLVSACTGESSPEANTVQRAARPRPDMETVMRGAKLYREHCASCHGGLAQGHPRWQEPDASGRYPPPPLNGSGHTWHHPTGVLKRTIREGTLSMGGKMPAWGGKLSEAEIEAIIDWFQSHWPDEIYAAWAEADAGARAAQR